MAKTLPGRPFLVIKDNWDSISLEWLNEMSNPMKSADIAVMVMQEGLMNLVLVKSAMTKTIATVTKSIPKKKQVLIDQLRFQGIH